MSDHEHLCPWWVGYLLASPIRKLMQHPTELLSPYVASGATVLDVGCAMGYFSLPLARLVGEEGSVVCVDLQDRMLKTLRRRASRAGLLGKLDVRLCDAESLGLVDLEGKVDFALAFAVIHEARDARVIYKQVFDSLAKGGQFLVSEPSGHVSEESFARSIAAALEVGFTEVDRPAIRRSQSVLLRK